MGLPAENKTNVNLASPEFWDNEWARVQLPCVLYQDSYFGLCFDAMFHKYLRKGKKSLFEVGCAPGRFLIHFAKQFNYAVSGIEFSKGGYLKTLDNLSLAGVQAHIMRGDFMNVFLRKNNYDVVFSAGFIEHFSKPYRVVEKKLSLVKPGGELLTTVPNFAGFFGMVRKIMNRELYDRHVVITLDHLRQIYSRLGLKSIDVGYFGSLRLRMPSPKPSSLGKEVLCKAGSKMDRAITRLYQELGKGIEGQRSSAYLYAYGVKPK